MERFEVGGEKGQGDPQRSKGEEEEAAEGNDPRAFRRVHRGSPRRFATSGRWARIIWAKAAPSISSSDVSLETRRASSENGPVVTRIALERFSPRAVSSAACTSAL